jgi:glutamine amidotransferase
MEVVIVDYGLGNLWSVRNALEFLGAKVDISASPDKIAAARCIILPGVGNFKRGMQNLHSLGLVDTLNDIVLDKKVPLLGICLGMQLMADESEEAPGVKGLGWIPGRVQRFSEGGIRMPHMGFNAVNSVGNSDDFFLGSDGVAPDFYFVHSYCFHPKHEHHTLAKTRYGSDFVSAVGCGGIIGVQFHPEKSQSNGLNFLSNFLKFSAAGNNA